jgi:hypothetical protein
MTNQILNFHKFRLERVMPKGFQKLPIHSLRGEFMPFWRQSYSQITPKLDVLA